MTPPASCLVLTHLPLVDLETRQYGIYKRLSTFLAALQKANFAIRIFTSSTGQQLGNTGAHRRPDIEAEMQRLWRINATVISGSPAIPSALPWIVHQLLGAISYSILPFIRFMLDDESLTSLKKEIDLGPALIFAHRLPMMHLLLSLRVAQSPIYFDLDDLEHLAALRSLAHRETLRDKAFSFLSVPSVRRAEQHATRAARCTFVCSDIDADRLRQLSPGSRVAVVRNAVESDFETPTAVRDPILLMVGIYSFQPNRDAAEYFITHVFPIIRESMPSAQAWFAGGAHDTIRTSGLDLAGITFLGFVPDLAAVYRAAKVVICPIQYGSGTRVKLVEAAGWGKAIVTTSIGAEGLNFTPGVHAAFGDSAKDFANRCIELLQNDLLCDQLGRSAQALAKDMFDRQSIVDFLAHEMAPIANHSVNVPQQDLARRLD